MSDTLKVLAQISPNAAVLTTAYTVPALTSTTASSCVICNTNATTSYFRISVAIGGAADALKQYLYYDLPLAGNDTFIATIGVTMAAGDIISVRGADAGLAFNFFGVELTP